MSIYKDYIQEIKERKEHGLHPKPIDDGKLLSVIIEHIKDKDCPERESSLNFFIYNVIPGTTSAALIKANFLKDIILKKFTFDEISSDFARLFV